MLFKVNKLTFSCSLDSSFILYQRYLINSSHLGSPLLINSKTDTYFSTSTSSDVSRRPSLRAYNSSNKFYVFIPTSIRTLSQLSSIATLYASSIPFTSSYSSTTYYV